MELLNFSETLKTSCTVFFLSLLFSFFGSYWIDCLYKKIQSSDLLSFPERIASRALFRKPLLFLLLLPCLGKAFITAAPPALYYITIAIAILSFVTATDFEQHVIFDSMLLPLALCGICYTWHMQLPLWEHFVAGLGGGLLFFILTLLSKGAIGGGDIKLIAALGFWLGYKPLVIVILYGAMAGGAAAFILLLTKKIKRKQYLAYGPYFALCGIGVLLNWIKT